MWSSSWCSWLRLKSWTWWRPHGTSLIVCVSKFQLFRIVVNIQKVYEFPNSTKTLCKTCTWNVGVRSNEQRYRSVASRSVMFWVSSLNLRSFLYSILSAKRRWWVVQFFQNSSPKNSSSNTRKNSLIGFAKASASMVGGMFVVATMSCWGKRFT
jgi:hypothetical protein